MTINNIKWRILLASPNHPMLKKSDGTYALGVCDKDIQSIFINNQLSLSKMKKVLCHEITHAAMFSYNIILDVNQEELVADLIATCGEEIVHMTNLIFYKLKRKGRT